MEYYKKNSKSFPHYVPTPSTSKPSKYHLPSETTVSNPLSSLIFPPVSPQYQTPLLCHRIAL